MSKRGAWNALAILLSASLAAPAAMGQAALADTDALRFVSSDTPASVARLSVAASILRGTVNPTDPQRERWDIMRRPDAPGTLLTLDRVFQDYQLRVFSDRMDAAQYGAAGFILQGAIIAGGAFVPQGTIAALAQGLGSAGASAGVSRVIDELTRHGEAQTARWLEDALAGLVQRPLLPLPADLSTVRVMAPEERRAWLMRERLVDDLLARAGNIRPEDRPIVEGMALRALNDRVRRGEIIQQDRDREQDEAIAGLARQISAVAGTLNQFRAETAGGLQRIHDEQASMNARLKVLEEYARETRADLDFVQRFMFDRMEPAEQLAALRSGMFTSMPEAERARLTARVAAVEQRERLMIAVGEFGQGAAALARIADRLGVDRNVVGALGRAAAVSQAAQTIAKGMMKGGVGYLAAADAAVGLVFGAGPDPGAQRHQQVMRALGQISQQISGVQDMIAAVSQQVEEVRRLQIAALEAAGRLSDQVQANHREMLAEIALVRADLVPIQSVINQFLFTPIERCSIFRQRLTDSGFTRERATSPSLTYGALRSIDQEERDGGNNHGVICREGLRTWLGNPMGPNITYSLDRFSTPNSEAERFLRQVFNPTWTLLNDHVFDAERIGLYARAFTTPVADLRAVEAKRAALLGSRPPDVGRAFAGIRPAEIARRLGTALSGQVIQRHACYLAFAHPFFEMAEALLDPTSVSLVSLATTNFEGRELLQTTIELVHTAIAQQVMLAGDITLPDLDRIWRTGVAPRAPGEADADFVRRTAAWEQLRAVLQSNGALRHNLILQAVSRAVRDRGNAVLYGTAHGLLGNPALLLTMLDEPQFVLRWVPTGPGQAPRSSEVARGRAAGWHLRIGDADYPLPTPLDIARGELAQTPELRGLLDLRNELTVELEGYLTPSRLTAAQREILRSAVLSISMDMTSAPPNPEVQRPCRD